MNTDKLLMCAEVQRVLDKYTMKAPYGMAFEIASDIEKLLARASHRAGGPSDLSRCASQPKALIPRARKSA